MPSSAAGTTGNADGRDDAMNTPRPNMEHAERFASAPSGARGAGQDSKAEASSTSRHQTPPAAVSLAANGTRHDADSRHALSSKTATPDGMTNNDRRTKDDVREKDTAISEMKREASAPNTSKRPSPIPAQPNADTRRDTLGVPLAERSSTSSSSSSTVGAVLSPRGSTAAAATAGGDNLASRRRATALGGVPDLSLPSASAHALRTDPPHATNSNADARRPLPATLELVASNVTMPSNAREEVVVKSRQGSVLTRGLVLKTDYFAGMRRPDLGVLLQGAPNFRQADVPGLQVYGVAQPTTTGLKTILSVLRCGPIHEDASTSLRGRREMRLPPMRREASERATSSSPSRTELKARGIDPSSGASLPTSSVPLAERRCVWACTRNEPVVYVSGRPFVLRESERPLHNFQLSGRATNLESIEHRLKADILRESARYGGLLMVHEEDESGGLRPAWIAVDADEVKTVREVWEGIRQAGWRCDYHRIPIAEDQPMEDNYLDAYTQIIKDIDPVNTAFVANCGLGMRRTSFAMVAAVLVRRKQMMLLGYADPFHMSVQHNNFATRLSKGCPSHNASPAPAPAIGVARSMQVTSQEQSQAQSTLEVIKTMSASLANVGGQQSAIDVLLYQPLLLSALRSAKDGDYGVIGQLVGLLDNGDVNKSAVDLAINACSQVINLRHSILEARVRYAVAAPEQETTAQTVKEGVAQGFLRQAVQALEQYYFLITFASYVEGSETAIFEHRFATWLRSRAEIWHAISKIRSKGQKLYFFDPIADLSALSRRATNHDAKGENSIVRRNDTDPHLVPGDEFADHVIRNRRGLVLRPHMLLKEDIWRSLKVTRSNEVAQIHGAVNFRHIPQTRMFATGQPTLDGIRNILRAIDDHFAPSPQQGPLQLTYINLREEPICHINGKPYCLRQKGMSLRNIKSYSGISWDRLTLLEDRLKNDVLSELSAGDGRLLLHTETEEGGVVPIWEEASPQDIETLQDVMTKIEQELDDASQQRATGVDVSLPNIHLIYRRLPITAEKPPSFEDLAAIVRAVLRSETQSNACIVLNCQLGRGRSTLVSIVALLVSRWLKKFSKESSDNLEAGDVEAEASSPLSHRPLTYHLINSLLRVIAHGVEVKQVVDSAIDQCDQAMNLREAIEEARIAAESTDDEQVKHGKVQTGVYHFRRYFQLIVFQAYLDATPPTHVDSMPTFEEFVRKQPVFSTFWSESDKVDISTITPLQKVDQSVGVALDDEVQEVVSNRAGNVLSTYTMLKSDMFPGLAAQALSQIEGIPNLRGESVLLGNMGPSVPSTPWSGPNSNEMLAPEKVETWGHGMPSIGGLRRGLEKIGSGPNGQIEAIATSLREEAVCVINGRPHVLRLADQPFTNVETTGITTEAVERMEESLKQDVIREIEKYDGRILLHDESVNEKTGQFDLFPIWETVSKEDVLTPKEMYQLVVREGYRVQYARVAVTDEQAPIPAVFHEMEERVLKALRLGAACVWNCQMGRGRTTTGMVIAALVSTVAMRGEEIFGGTVDMNASFLSGTLSSFLQNPSAEASSANESVDNREDELLLRGEYRTVLQLIAILKHGKLAKRLTDNAIDRMDAVQNLRKAIYDSKLRAANADASMNRQAHLRRVYRNYLERYGYLIVFANYLLEKAHAMVERGLSSRDFTKDLSMRPLSGLPEDGNATETDSNAAEDISNDEGDAMMSSSVTSTSAMSRMSTDTAASLFVRDDSRRIFPSFISWLQPRREIHSILGREQLE